MASGLGGERPSCSTGIANSKRRRVVEVVGKHERLGKNGRRRWYRDMEGKRPFVSQLPGNINRPNRPSQVAST